MNTLPVLAIVIPCYNEQQVLPTSSGLFLDELQHLVDARKVAPDSYIMFVDDGSKDATWQIIEQLTQAKPEAFRGLRLSRNRGHQNALLAGLTEATNNCDISISIDCDGQDDIATMEKMVDEYAKGFDVVYGVRSSRETDTGFKRGTAQAFYRLMEKLGVETVYNHADYRLLSNKALLGLAQFKEVNLFLRGMVPLVGFASTSVYYERHERMAGESHYPLSKMAALAINGITSLSVKPIRIITVLGFIVSLVSFIGVIWALISSICGATVTGWASTMCVVCLLSGVQLLSIGVIGEYIGKIYLETKARPRFIISERTHKN